MMSGQWLESVIHVSFSSLTVLTGRQEEYHNFSMVPALLVQVADENQQEMANPCYSEK